MHVTPEQWWSFKTVTSTVSSPVNLDIISQCRRGVEKWLQTLGFLIRYIFVVCFSTHKKND